MIAALETADHDMIETAPVEPLDFTLPPELEANAPPEERGTTRDGVRLMVSRVSTGKVGHTIFSDLPEILDPGDLLLINTSGTLNASLPAIGEEGLRLALHLSTRLRSGLWIVELRRPAERGTAPFLSARQGERISLPDGGSVTLVAPHGGPAGTAFEGGSKNAASGPEDGTRLWSAALELPAPLDSYLAEHGSPIRYRYVEKSWPLSYYRTVYATEDGSAEMPSAGRPFTFELITRLAARGIVVAPVLLHTGVASQESHEPPYEEFYRVTKETARLVNMTRRAGRRVIAVGTTAVRAIETLADERGIVHPGEGWTDLVVTPERGIRAVDGIITGLHEPKASHLSMLEAFAGRAHLRQAYRSALAERYLWHEFGDSHLILP